MNAGRAIAASVLALIAGQAAAQPPAAAPQPQPARTIDPLEISGRTFSGLRLQVPLTAGRISFSARRADSWAETGPPTIGSHTSGTVQRLLLTGDARIRLGPYEFTAERAVVWAAHLDPSEPDAAPDVWQVWVYLDRVGTSSSLSSITVAGDRMPVQGLLKAPDGIELRVDKLSQGRPDDPAVAAAERVLAQRLRRMIEGSTPKPQAPENLLKQGQPVPALTPEPEAEPGLTEQARRISEAAGKLPPAERDAPIFPKGGEFTFVTKGDIQIVSGQDESAAILGGGVTIQYWDRERDRTHELTAERAVVFFEPGPLSQEIPRLIRSRREQVKGIYLEGDVVAQIAGDQGRYTLRAPRVFYSVRDDRALLIDAVFWAYDQKMGLPLYVRAKTISQQSRNEFTATSARITNTAFAEPDLAIGASTVTIRPQPPGPGQERGVYVDARDVTLRAAGVPFFYWPRISGDPRAIPLRDFRVENSSGSGTAVKTAWNVYSLLGIQAPSGSTADVFLDWYFDRGAGLGTAVGWSDANSHGGFFGYGLPSDTGRDVLPTGEKLEHHGEARGMITGEHREMLSDEWTFFAEGSYISDPTFVSAFFEPLAQTRREFTNALYLRRLRENTSLSLLGKGNFNGFIANEYLLQSPGYTVDKFPDLQYSRLADDILKDYPGLLTYSSEYRLTEMRLNFPSTRPEDIGFHNPATSQLAFGLNPAESFADAFKARGLSPDPVTRFDTRHELDMPLQAGPVNITPFVTGRITAYSNEFDSFSPGADQNYRLWSDAGIRVSTEFQRVDNSVESRLFDLHRIRHIVQPSITVWHADTTLSQEDLPVYDDEVESIAQGSAARFAVDQVWQTQRGGPGRWRSVDFFRLNAEIVTSSGSVNKESPIGRFFDYRPELSTLGGTFATIDAALQLTEVLGLGADVVYDFDISQAARTDLGFTLEQSPTFTAYMDLRYLNAEDQTSLLFGGSYQLTPKYSVLANATYDTTRSTLQNVSTEIRRRYPNVILGVGYSYNNITKQSSFGVIFQPVGVTRPGARLLSSPGAGGFGAGG